MFSDHDTASTLEQLFPNYSAAQFRELAATGQLVLHHGPAARLPELPLLDETASIPDFIRKHTGRVRLHLTANPPRYRADITVSPREAAAFYEHGISVNLEGFDSAVPEVSAVLDRLAEELGIPRKYCFCSAFVSPKGSGLPLHFDSKDVVVLQVAGRKRWTVAQNSSISDPVVNHTAGGAYSSRHMRQYAEEVASVTPPEELQIVDMRPGSTLYLPRGYWHGTNADEESISLSFGFAAPSWAAVFVDRLQDALLLSDHWRAPAVRMSSAPAEFVPSAIAELMQAATADILGGALSNAIRDLVESSRGLSSIRPSKGQHPITTAPPAEPHPLEESHVPATNH